MVPVGKYQAVAVSGEFGITPEKKTKHVRVSFRLETKDEHNGVELSWDGWFTDKSTDRTIEALINCGCTFPDDDLTDLTGLGSKPVTVTVQHEEYEKDGQKKVAAKIAWVNAPGGFGLSQEAQMDAAAKAEFKSKMKGTLAAFKAKAGGASAPAAAAPGTPPPF